jgi:glutamine synthetase
MTALPDGAKLAAEARGFLEANRDVTHIAMVFTDLCGVARGKLLTREELEPAFRSGRYFPGSMLSIDVTGRDVEETGLVWEDGDGDRLCWAVPGTLSRVPWLMPNDTEAQYLATIHELDGTPAVADPRQTLARVIERFNKETGYNPVVAIELEFYLMDRDSALAGRPNPPRSLTNGAHTNQIQCYLLQDLEDFGPFFRDMYAGAEIQGIPAEALISEYAPGQMEIGLKHRADALRACDDAIMFKRLVKGTADKHGLIASFMAKPYKDQAGCGMHIHVSLNDKNGKNAFASPDPSKHPLLLHAVAGLKDTMADSLAIYAPNANSYRRFRKQMYAPVKPNWGINNRTVSIRIPAATGSASHLEHRISGADANPYLAAAAVLAGMLHGINGKRDPGPPIKGNGYAQPADPLPTQWIAAIDALRKSAPMREYLGSRFVDVFTAIKEAEADRFYAEPQPLDFDYYLRNI